MINSKKKVYIYTTSMCSRRLLDAERIRKYCKFNGYSLTLNPKKADYIIVNSCALHKYTENESIVAIKELKKFNGKLLVAGCLPVINDPKLKEIFKGPTVTPLTLNKIENFIPKKTYHLTRYLMEINYI